MQVLKNIFIISTIVFFSTCSLSSSPKLPDNFNDCKISLNDALNVLEQIKTSNDLNFDIRIVREVTSRDECIDMVLGTNLEQGAELVNGRLVDLVVGIKKDEVTESVKETEYDLYIQQLRDKDIEDLNLITKQIFGTATISNLIDGQKVVTYIKYENPMDYKFMFSEAEGFIYGVDVDGNVSQILNISDKTVRERESGLHTFDFLTIDSKEYLIATYSGTDNKYYLSAFELLSSKELGNEYPLVIFDLQNQNNVHFGGKILQSNDSIFMCLGDLNSPGNSAKFDSPWGKVLSISNQNLLEDPIRSINDERLSFIAYGLRNPWSCFFQNQNLIVPDVGNSHWEEINLIKDIETATDPLFFGWPWLESYFDANYKNLPVDEETKFSQINQTVYPKFLFPHANDYCAIIGGTTLSNSNKWDEYIFVGDFCTGTIWAINFEKDSELIVLEKNLIPYSITTINDSGNGTLYIGTTSGQILEITLP